ncbi:MAG: HAF family extracellular repeat-containing protein, partial [bacterium]
YPGRWMSTVHEAQIFPPLGAGAPVGWDRTPDTGDLNQLRAEIFPDHILTPGCRIDYYLRSVGACDYDLPDGPGGSYFEMEVLPSSTAADTTWNCTLYVDGHGDRDEFDRTLEQTGLTVSLGAGGNNAEGTRYDRFDIQAPTSLQASFGRSLSVEWGAAAGQTPGYQTIVWHAGTIDQVGITNRDVEAIRPWMILPEGGGKAFWLSGDNSAEMLHAWSPGTRSFLNNILGVQQNCTDISSASCPSGSGLNLLGCRTTAFVIATHFTPSAAYELHDPTCPTRRGFDLLSLNPAIVTARGHLNYIKSAVARNYASVTNLNTIDVTFKTVIDGFGVGAVRTGGACPANVTASYNRTDDVLDWFGASQGCSIPAYIVDTPEPEPAPGGSLTQLGRIAPNPLSTAAVIQFSIGQGGGNARLQILDVTGRLIRTLVDAPLPAGAQEVSWNGRNEQGSAVSGGMYYARLTMDDGRFVVTRSLVVVH